MILGHRFCQTIVFSDIRPPRWETRWDSAVLPATASPNAPIFIAYHHHTRLPHNPTADLLNAIAVRSFFIRNIRFI
jgi:hypothetical protein